MAVTFGTLAKQRGHGHPEKATLALISLQKVLQLSNNEKKRVFKPQQGSYRKPAPTILLNFLRRFGSGSRSRFVTSAIDGYRDSPGANSVLLLV